MRALDTYRGARRNQQRGAFVPEVAARYVPYQIKSPVLKRLGVAPNGKPLYGWVPRKQPKQYPAGWRTRAERAAGPRQ